jgi:hypothetical protein
MGGKAAQRKKTNSYTSIIRWTQKGIAAAIEKAGSKGGGQ